MNSFNVPAHVVPGGGMLYGVLHSKTIVGFPSEGIETFGIKTGPAVDEVCADAVYNANANAMIEIIVFVGWLVSVFVFGLVCFGGADGTALKCGS